MCQTILIKMIVYYLLIEKQCNNFLLFMGVRPQSETYVRRRTQINEGWNMFTQKKNFAPYCQNYCFCMSCTTKKKTAKEKTSILYKSVVNDVGASHYFMYLIWYRKRKCCCYTHYVDNILQHKHLHKYMLFIYKEQFYEWKSYSSHRGTFVR